MAITKVYIPRRASHIYMEGACLIMGGEKSGKTTIANYLHNSSYLEDHWKEPVKTFICPIPTEEFLESYTGLYYLEKSERIQWFKVALNAFTGKSFSSMLEESRSESADISSHFCELDRICREERRHLVLLVDDVDHFKSPCKKGLMQLALFLKSFSNFHIKVFMKPSFWKDNYCRNFPDASKLNAITSALTWDPVDILSYFESHVDEEVVKGAIRQIKKKEMVLTLHQVKKILEIP